MKWFHATSNNKSKAKGMAYFVIDWFRGIARLLKSRGLTVRNVFVGAFGFFIIVMLNNI